MTARKEVTYNRAANALITLKRHLRSCKECSAGLKAGSAHLMCAQGLTMTVSAAKLYDGVISARVAAKSNGGDLLFLCPDTTQHGIAYALTALPVAVTGIQDRLI